MTADMARASVRGRLASRGPDFLGLIRHTIFGRPESPYRWLLDRAGCSFADLERLVTTAGLDGALVALFRAGVYLTVDELKGRMPVTRGGATRWIEPGSLRSLGATGLYGQTSGSHGESTPVFHDLRFIRESAVSRCVGLAARGGLGWRFGHWGVPGATTLIHVLEFLAFGVRPDAWFWQIDPSELRARYRWSVSAIRAGACLGGAKLPRPRYIPLDDPRPIADWMSGVLRAGHTPHLVTFASLAARVCKSATEAGVDLTGAQFTAGGEPLTHRRRAQIEEAGATVIPRYASMECGPIGVGCDASRLADAVHVVSDLVAIVPAGAAEPLPTGALLVTSLHATAPLVLLNVSLGDEASIAATPCGCELERLGWTMRLERIRSFAKLTAGGMTYHDADVAQILEETLPRRFGGTAADYQLLEEERTDGQPSVVLLVHPRLGPLDAKELTAALLGAMADTPGTGRILSLQWRAAEMVRVERTAPQVTGSGKLRYVRRRESLGPGAP